MSLQQNGSYSTASKSRAPTAVVSAEENPSFRIGHKATYKHQYSNIYWQRLRVLRPIIEKTAIKRWKGIAGKPSLVRRVLDIEKGQLCYAIGTIYMDMPLKPNVLEAIAKDNALSALPPSEKIYSPEDDVNMEDESGRIRLIGSVLKDARLVTGVIVAALGVEAQDGSFEVVDICAAGLSPQPELEEEEEEGMAVDANGAGGDADEWIAVVSGLDIGSVSPADAQIQMLVEYLTGEGGTSEDQRRAAQISRLIIAGDSLAPQVDNLQENQAAQTKKQRQAQSAAFSAHPVLNLSAALSDLAASIPIHLLPGATDPSGAILPQQPLPRAMFGEASRFSTFSCETNPTYLKITNDVESEESETSRRKYTRNFLINSGQPLDDMFRYLPTPPHTRLAILESTLRWRHIAPTAPDTLWCHPFSDGDPFLIPQTPDVYIVGGQKKFGTKLVVDREDGRRNGGIISRCRVITVPSFATTGILVLVNLRTLAVKTVRLTVKGMTSGGEEVEMDGSLKAPSPTPVESQSSLQESMDSTQDV